MGQITKDEKDRRTRLVQEWLIEGHPIRDILKQIKAQWGIEERQGKRYIAEAREAWQVEEQESLDMQRRKKIEKLEKIGRSLKEPFKGTPMGIRALISVEKEIISLEGIRPAQKVEVLGKGGTDLFAAKSDEELKKTLQEILTKVNE